MIRYVRPALLAAGLLAAAAAGAHESPHVLSTVETNPRTGQLEVIHRFGLHDVEHAVRRFDWGSTDVLANARDRQRFSAYVQDRFSLRIDGEPVPLALVGQELEGRYLWVYQEAGQPGPAQSVKVINRVLSEPPRHHLVKVQLKNIEGSLVFEPGVTELTLDQAR